MKKDKAYKLWKKVFPKIKLRKGMYVKCADGRKAEGFLLGWIRNIHDYSRFYSCSHLTLNLESVPNRIDKRDCTVMCEVTQEEYVEWAKKEWLKRGWVTTYLNGRWIHYSKEEAKAVFKAFGKTLEDSK